MINLRYPVDTGRKLNVLCTFNLCPVSMGIYILASLISGMRMSGIAVRSIYVLCLICSTLRDLVPFLQFKKHEKYSWRSVTFGKVAGF